MGGHKGFVNVDLDVLMGEGLELLPNEHVILELLETIDMDRLGRLTLYRRRTVTQINL